MIVVSGKAKVRCEEVTAVRVDEKGYEFVVEHAKAGPASPGLRRGSSRTERLHMRLDTKSEFGLWRDALRIETLGAGGGGVPASPDADADADADTFAEQSEMGTAPSVSTGARWRRVRQQSEFGAAVGGFAFGGGLADASLPAASVSAMGAAARRGPSCCQLTRARAGRGGHRPPSHMRRSIAAANAAAADEANEAARAKAAEEQEARRLWEATFGAAAGPPPPGNTALAPTGPGRSADAPAARYPPPPAPPPAAATTGAAAWLAAAEEEEDAEMVSAEISARRRALDRASSRAELDGLPTATPPAKPKRSSSMLRRLSFGRKASSPSDSSPRLEVL